MAKPSSERDHSRSKHKARWRRPALERTEKDDDEHAAWRKKYYRGPRPDIDPQSTVSKGLEFLGLDEPYREDTGSYDYRQRKWDQSLAAGNPDLSWFLPELQDGVAGQISRVPEDVVTAVAGGQERDRISSRGTASAMLAKELGRTPSEDEVDGFLAAIGDDELARANMRDYLGREPTDEDWARWVAATTDPRTRDEKMAGMALALNPLDFFGVSDEVSAGVNTLFGGNYDDELQKARAVQSRYEALEDPWSGRNIAAMVGSTGAALAGPVAGSFKAFETGVRGLRGLAGLAPQATTRLGKAASTVASGAPAGAVDMTAMQLGSGEGGFESRLSGVDPALTIGGAVGGGVLWPLIGAGAAGVSKGVKAAMGAPSAIAKLIKKRRSAKPKPGTPPRIGDEPLPKWPDRAGPTPEPRLTGATGTPPWRVSDRQGVRNAIGQAMRPVPGAGVVGAGALGGAGVMAYKAAEERRKKRRK